MLIGSIHCCLNNFFHFGYCFADKLLPGRFSKLVSFGTQLSLNHIVVALISQVYSNLFIFLRPKWEGGEYEGDDKQRFEALCLAMELGAEYVDVELKVGFSIL